MATILTFLGWTLVVILGLAGLFMLVCIPHNLRIRRVRRAYRALPKEVADQTLRLIEEAAKSCPSVTFLRLTHIRMPVESTGDRVPPSPRRLCQIIPAIPQLLDRYSTDQGGLLTQILRPNVYSCDLEEWQVAYLGGDPTLIQNPHDPKCDECGKPMRFLFMFGEVIPGLQLADAGVCCIYGCDDHPLHCKGFIDSH